MGRVMLVVVEVADGVVVVGSDGADQGAVERRR